MRAILLLTISLAAPSAAGEIAIRTDLSSLDLSQRKFVHAFVRGDDAQHLAQAAAFAGLPGAASYLRAVDDRTRERVWKHAAGEPIVIIDRGDRREIGMVAADSDWLEYLGRYRQEFERTLPGFAESWLATTGPSGRVVAADLIWRSGNSLSPGTFLPFDASFRPELGRSYILWKNVIEQSWFERQVRPAAQETFTAAALRDLRAEGLSSWYATRFLMDSIGAEVIDDHPVSDRIGDLHAPLTVAKADVLAVLATEWLAKRIRPPAAVEHDAVVATVMAFHALADVRRGEAPPAHEKASALVLSWLHRARALRLDRSRKWSIDRSKLLPAYRSLAAEILRVEAAADPVAVAKLFDEHPLPRGMEKSVEAVAKLPRLKDTPRFEAQGVALP